MQIKIWVIPIKQIVNDMRYRERRFRLELIEELYGNLMGSVLPLAAIINNYKSSFHEYVEAGWNKYIWLYDAFVSGKCRKNHLIIVVVV